ncbi:electromotor neuron-associated protein 1-like [Trichomycterus rosablanca]|uniref:electromotor neuron-associated protein 1-like n=1 Tax=Trichomycterus rosablanca TaxID=2290929 RepID=UPI002F354C5D
MLVLQWAQRSSSMLVSVSVTAEKSPSVSQLDKDNETRALSMLGQQRQQYKSDGLETAVLVNPSVHNFTQSQIRTLLCDLAKHKLLILSGQSSEGGDILPKSGTFGRKNSLDIITSKDKKTPKPVRSR